MDQQQIINCNGKRKSAGEAAAHYHSYSLSCGTIFVPPRFISCKAMRYSQTPTVSYGRSRPVNPWPEQQPVAEEACFASLPRELFCNIVAYLGPTSSSLCSLSRVSRDHNAVMTTIGNVMLQRAKMRFRTPMVPKSMCESSISLFIRHARVSKAVHDNLEVVNEVLKKDFPTLKTSPSIEDIVKLPLEFDCNHSFKCKRTCVEPSEVNDALNVALCLLGCPKQHYFEDSSQAEEIASGAATTALEWRVSYLCSKLGAKAYKYAKSRMCQRYEREDDIYSAYAVSDEMQPLEDDSDDDDEEYDDISIDASEVEADEDMRILDKASMVMQHALLREENRAQRSGLTSPAMNFGVYKGAGLAVRQYGHA